MKLLTVYDNVGHIQCNFRYVSHSLFLLNIYLSETFRFVITPSLFSILKNDLKIYNKIKKCLVTITRVVACFISTVKPSMSGAPRSEIIFLIWRHWDSTCTYCCTWDCKLGKNNCNEDALNRKQKYSTHRQLQLYSCFQWFERNPNFLVPL